MRASEQFQINFITRKIPRSAGILLALFLHKNKQNSRLEAGATKTVYTSLARRHIISQKISD
jgi:hypothetical protein